MTIQRVSIGDQFIDTMHRKTKRVSTVVDFIEKKSLVTGEVVGYDVVAEHNFMGQTLKTKCCSTTVLRNRINNS